MCSAKGGLVPLVDRPLVALREAIQPHEVPRRARAASSKPHNVTFKAAYVAAGNGDKEDEEEEEAPSMDVFSPATGKAAAEEVAACGEPIISISCSLPTATVTAASTAPVAGSPGGGSIPVGSLFQSRFLSRSVLCHSILGNPLPLLTITDMDPKGGHSTGIPWIPLDTRPVVVLSARVHPGETNASWMMRGALDFLTSGCEQAQALRRLAVFKVVPFLNPDGVISGHHRVNMAGLDLNRHWTTPTRNEAPTIWHLRHLLLSVKRQNRGPLLFCDFHGHSRRRNVFMFGCDDRWAHGTPGRLFPYLLSRTTTDFAFGSCSFKISRAKANCARVAMARDLPLAFSYTIEASFAGATQGARALAHFDTRQLECMGHDFCGALLGLVGHIGGSGVESAGGPGQLDAAAAGVGPGPRAALSWALSASGREAAEREEQLASMLS